MEVRLVSEDLPDWVRALIAEWERCGVGAIPGSMQSSAGDLLVDHGGVRVVVPRNGPDRIVIEEPGRVTTTFRVPLGPGETEPIFARVRTCPRCGEPRGFSYLSADPDPTPVLCICDGIRCRHCGRGMVRRPISDRLDADTGELWHAPYFAAQLPCDECPE